MSTLVVYSSSGDGYIASESSVSSTQASNGTGTISTFTDNLLAGSYVDDGSTPVLYWYYQGLTAFNTSALGTSANISSATLTLYCYDWQYTGTVTAKAKSWLTNGLGSEDFTTLTNVASLTSVASVTQSASGSTAFTSTGSMVTSISKTGNTEIGIYSTPHWTTGGDTNAYYAAIATGTTNDPTLTITYTTGGAVTVSNAGQANGKIKITATGTGQTAGKIKGTTASTGQALSAIEATTSSIGQVLGTIKASKTSSGQAFSTIEIVAIRTGQTKAAIKATSNVVGQPLANIKGAVTSVGQALTSIKGKPTFIGQALGSIKAQISILAQSLATIKYSTTGFGQARVTIEVTNTSIGQAFATIEATKPVTAQVLATIKTKTTSVAQAQTSIGAKNTFIGQALATIEATTTAFGQAKVSIEAIGTYSGQAGASIEANRAFIGQARTLIGYAATIKIPIAASGDDVTITNGGGILSTSTSMYVGIGTGSVLYRSFLAFDLNLPTTTILSANLYLTAWTQMASAINVEILSADWRPADSTDFNLSGTVIGTFNGSPSNPTAVSIPTSYVASALNTGLYFRLVNDAGDRLSNSVFSYDYGDAAKAPYLTITYIDTQPKAYAQGLAKIRATGRSTSQALAQIIIGSRNRAYGQAFTIVAGKANYARPTYSDNETTTGWVGLIT